MIFTAVVSNTSPLIALDQIGHLQLLKQLFSQLLIPPAVRREIQPKPNLEDWIIERSLQQPIGPQILGASLGNGESEAVALALEVSADLLIIDERPGRRLAEMLGVPVIGTLGILLASKRRGYLPLVKPSVDALIALGFRVAASLYDDVIRDAGESVEEA